MGGRSKSVTHSQETTSSVINRIVEKNEAFFRLISTSGLTRDEQFALLHKAIPSSKEAPRG